MIGYEWLDKIIEEQQASHRAAGISPEDFSLIADYIEQQEWNEQLERGRNRQED